MAGTMLRAWSSSGLAWWQLREGRWWWRPQVGTEKRREVAMEAELGVAHSGSRTWTPIVSGRTIGKQAVRVYQSTNVPVTGITIQNSARFHLTFDTCRAVAVHGAAVRSPGDSPNMDGIHLAGSISVSIHNSTVTCGDDCVSIQDGCSGVLVRGITCGPGHGISIGGLGKGGATAVVSDVDVQDVSLVRMAPGVRIKTWQRGFSVTGTYTQRPVYLACSDAAPCAGVHFEDIQLVPAKDDGDGHLYGPFCWKAYGNEVLPVVPPVDCLMAGEP
ncbi:hypothetical protein E2562_035352 [Oryza meyeriana var. granulata]|uniref:Polygalacturonase n=1 Tax=Oryza meyeriana var. granulata TaxID=110450 RepID=A0A6G1CWL6_9ORYZ|nr:hypothetical protein E2562_035352 [Oryza meyeriana var. granulata]